MSKFDAGRHERGTPKFKNIRFLSYWVSIIMSRLRPNEGKNEFFFNRTLMRIDAPVRATVTLADKSDFPPQTFEENKKQVEPVSVLFEESKTRPHP
jgi:hypothetical protein